MENDFSPVFENKADENNPCQGELTFTEMSADREQETELKIATIVKEVDGNQLISRPYACTICDYKTVHRDNLEVHLHVHIQKNPSGQKTKDKKSVINGVKENPFSCKICSLNFPTKSNLQTHAVTHSGEKPLACNICNYRTSSKTALQKHSKVAHLEPYGCGICNASFGDKVSLKDHFLKIHSLQM